LCKIRGLQLIYCVARNELQWDATGETAEYSKTVWSDSLTKASEEGMIVDEFDNRNASLGVIDFLRREVARKYDNDERAKIIPLRIFAFRDKFYVIDSIKEMLLVMSNFIPAHPAIASPETYKGTIFISIKTSDYLEALYKIFPRASFYVLITGVSPDPKFLEPSRTELVKSHTVSFNREDPAYKKWLTAIDDQNMKEKISKVEPSVASIYPHFLDHGKPGDLCLFYT